MQRLSDYSDYDVKVKFYTLKKESGDYYNIVLSIEGVNGNLNLLNSSAHDKKSAPTNFHGFGG